MKREFVTVAGNDGAGLNEAEIAALALSFFPGLSFNEVTRTLNVVNLLALFQARSRLLLRMAEQGQTASADSGLVANETYLLSQFLQR
jgi:hypothetical protein